MLGVKPYAYRERDCHDNCCERCGKGPKAGAAGLCQSCNDEGDREAETGVSAPDAGVAQRFRGLNPETVEPLARNWGGVTRPA